MPVTPSPLKAAAAAFGLTLADVADAIGCSPSHVRNISLGTSIASAELRQRMADLFGFDPLADARYSPTLTPAVARIVAATRDAQGHPETVEDPQALAKVAVLADCEAAGTR